MGALELIEALEGEPQSGVPVPTAAVRCACVLGDHRTALGTEATGYCGTPTVCHLSFFLLVSAVDRASVGGSDGPGATVAAASHTRGEGRRRPRGTAFVFDAGAYRFE